MPNLLALTRRSLCGLLFLSIAGVASLAEATNVKFVGSVGFSANGTSIILVADQVHNSDVVTSAPLRLELWATPTPFSGSFASGYAMGQYALGSLSAGASVKDISSGLVPFTSPPAGLWYVAMVLTEHTGGAANGGYTPADYLRFPTQFPGSGPPPPPPPPPTDTTPPTIGITSPAAGNVSGTVTISASASDNVGVTRVDFYVNGALVGSDSAAPYQYSWNTTSLANGAASLRVIAFDAAGNSGQASVSVTVANGPPPDTTPPVIAIASPVSGNVSGTVTISANASDNVGVTRVDFYVNGAVVGSDSALPWQFSWNTTSVANGAATLRAVAYDAAGNSGSSSVVSVTVANVVTPPPPPPDSTPPTAAIASPLGGTVSGMVAVQVTASDNVGVMRVDLVANGQVVATDNGAPWQFSWNSASVANGSATLRAVAYDAAGNSGTSSTITVTVANAGPPPPTDTVPPTVAIASPTAGSVSGIVNVAVNASDNVGVTRVDLVVEGQILATDTAAPWQFSWNSASVANGVVHVQAVARDAAGNVGTSSVVLLTIANAGTPPKTPTGYAVEFYNASLNHYFITASQSEVAVLDSGGIAGWTRTGLSFKVYSVLGPTASPVCRIYIPPPYGNSHFFSASPAECADAITKYPYFEYEAADVFYVTPPDAAGNCPAGDAPVYRLWDNRADTNHRYTTSWQVREQMIAQGWVPEGYGPDAVMMCSPP